MQTVKRRHVLATWRHMVCVLWHWEGQRGQHLSIRILKALEGASRERHYRFCRPRPPFARRAGTSHLMRFSRAGSAFCPLLARLVKPLFPAMVQQTSPRCSR